MRSSILSVLAVSALSCAPERPPERPKPRGPNIQVFTEPAPVAAVAAIGATVFTGSPQGLDRWEVGSGKRKRLGAAEGMVGSTVRALAIDAAGVLWFTTESGVGKLDVASDRVVMMPPPPAPLTGVLANAHAIAPDPKGGAWVGATTGLFHAGEGGFQPTAMRSEVTALHVGGNGALWIGTRGGLIERNLGGAFTPISEGSTLSTVLAIAEAPDGALAAVGKDAQGNDRVAVMLDGSFTTYRLSVDADVTGAVHREGALVLLTPGRLLTLVMPDSSEVGLEGNGVQLLHVTGKRKRPPYVVVSLETGVPREITSAAASAQSTYLGTRTLGTERVVAGRAGATITHLRARELVAGARGLSVACVGADECYLATGGTAAWRFDGRSFTRLSIEAKPVITLAFVRSPQGDVLGLYREPSERRVHVARLDKGTFVPKAELQVETPSGATLLSFAKFAPDGLLWLGLQYVDSDGDARPYGVALVNLDLGAVSYHRETNKKVGVLPVPNDVVDVAFLGDETWFASGSGAARLKGESIRVWTEADALRSEILHGVVATEGGLVYVASSSGVGQFDGERWTYPSPLAVITNGIARGRDGKLWLGTERGLILYDGGKSSRYDRRAGLLDDRVFDVTVDEVGRVWARGTDGISLATP